MQCIKRILMQVLGDSEFEKWGGEPAVSHKNKGYLTC